MTRAFAVAIACMATLVAGCHDDTVTNSISPLNTFHQTTLVADISGTSAVTVDPDLVNPWGIAFGPTGLLWVSNNGTGTSTLYDGAGNKNSLTVHIPSASLLTTATPTGTVVNSSTDFAIAGGPAIFLFAAEDGTISAWNPSAGSNAALVIDRSSLGASYKGIAIASIGGTNHLFATDFHDNRVDVFDAQFNFVGSFTDLTVPSDYAPFGIQNIGGRLFVTFAKQEGPDNVNDDPGAGNGFVDIFNADGTMASRFASNGSLNSPWGVAMAPASFGAFAGDILVGNFGDGFIGVYDTNGRFIDMLRDPNSVEIQISGLWGLAFGPALGSTTLYWSAGADNEAHGLVGTLTPP